MTGQRSLVAMLSAKMVTVAVGARPVAALDGVDITPWRVNGIYGTPLAAVMMNGTAAASVTGPSGSGLGAELWGYAQTKWWLIGYLNNGSSVPIVANGQGFAQELDVIGIFDRLAIAGDVSAGAATASLAPMDVYQ